MTNSTTPELSDEALAEMESDLADSPLATFPMTTEQARALCQTVRALKAENERLRELVRHMQFPRGG